MMDDGRIKIVPKSFCSGDQVEHNGLELTFITVETDADDKTAIVKSHCGKLLRVQLNELRPLKKYKALEAWSAPCDTEPKE